VQNNDAINCGGTVVNTVIAMTGTSPVTGNNHYASAGAGGYTLDSNSIARKAGKGPKVSYLTAVDVGVTGDLDELDRTGAAV
jgi:hypothetical protein